MTKILIADGMDPEALGLLKAVPGFEVTVQKGMSEADLIQTVPGYSAVVVRSASRITRPVIEAGKDLKVLVRAGIGLDNVDVEAATRGAAPAEPAPSDEPGYMQVVYRRGAQGFHDAMSFLAEMPRSNCRILSVTVKPRSSLP